MRAIAGCKTNEPASSIPSENEFSHQTSGAQNGSPVDCFRVFPVTGGQRSGIIEMVLIALALTRFPEHPSAFF